MADTTDYHAAAVAALKSGPPGGEPSAPVAAEAPKLDESKLIVEPPKEVAKVEATEPPKEVKSDSIRKSFETLAREKAEVRAERERFRRLEGIEKELGPQGIHELLAAKARGDTAGVLKALGIKPGDVQYQAAEEKIESIKNPPVVDPRFDALQKELESLKAERQAEKYSTGRKATLERTANLAKAPEFDLISDEPAAHDEALKMVEDYIKAHNEMPAETPEESLKLALSAVNERYLEEAAKWEKRLTKVKKVDTIKAVSESPVQSTPAESEVGKSRTLTNSLSSSTPPSPNSSPQSDEDYHRLAIAAMKNMG